LILERVVAVVREAIELLLALLVVAHPLKLHLG
jgi:hypothetical protein